MSFLARDKIIVLKNRPFSESDLIVQGLNSKGLRLSFIAKNALKSQRRFAGGLLEPSSYIELEYSKKNKGLQNIRQAWPLKSFHKLRESYGRLNLALYFLKLSAELSVEGGEESEELFHLLGNALVQAEKSQFMDSLKLFFQVKILFLQGILPKELAVPQILKSVLSKHQSFKMSPDQKKILSSRLDQCLKLHLSA